MEGASVAASEVRHSQCDGKQASIAIYRELLYDCPYHRSEGFAHTGYDIPGCMKDGAWMLWRNSSVVVAVIAVVVLAVAVAHPDLGKLTVLEFHYGIGASGVRGSFRLVFRSTDARILRKVVVGKNQMSKKGGQKIKNSKNGYSIMNLL